MEIRDFWPDDAAAVRALFIRVNRLLAPPDMRERFESYIARSLTEEIDRVSDLLFGTPGRLLGRRRWPEDRRHVRARAGRR